MGSASNVRSVFKAFPVLCGRAPCMCHGGKPGTWAVAYSVAQFSKLMLLWVCSAGLQLGVNQGLAPYVELGGSLSSHSLLCSISSIPLWFPKSSFLTPLARKTGFFWSCDDHRCCSRKNEEEKRKTTGVSSIPFAQQGPIFLIHLLRKMGFISEVLDVHATVATVPGFGAGWLRKKRETS